MNDVCPRLLPDVLVIVHNCADATNRAKGLLAKTKKACTVFIIPKQGTNGCLRKPATIAKNTRQLQGETELCRYDFTVNQTGGAFACGELFLN
jgi:hypothetical protein